MDSLELSTYLAPSLDPVAALVAEALSADLSIPVRFDPAVGVDQRLERIMSGAVEVVWMCGLLTAEMIAAGRWAGSVTAAPVFTPDTKPVYHSVVIVNDESDHESVPDLAGRRLAINGIGSWSGHHVLRDFVRRLGFDEGFFGSVTESGSHLGSVMAVGAGEADWAAIDHTVWGSLAESERSGLRVLARTQDWPSPPLSIAASLPDSIGAAVARSLPGLASDPSIGAGLRRHGVEGFFTSRVEVYQPMARVAASLAGAATSVR